MVAAQNTGNQLPKHAAAGKTGLGLRHIACVWIQRVMSGAKPPSVTLANAGNVVHLAYVGCNIFWSRFRFPVCFPHFMELMVKKEIEKK